MSTIHERSQHQSVHMFVYVFLLQFVCIKCVKSADDKIKEDKIQKEMEEYLAKLRERTRRTLVR